MWLVKRVSKTFLIQRFWKTFNEPSSAIPSAHFSDPYLTTVITVTSTTLVLIRGLTLPFFQTFFDCEKIPCALAILRVIYKTIKVFVGTGLPKIVPQKRQKVYIFHLIILSFCLLCLLGTYSNTIGL